MSVNRNDKKKSVERNKNVNLKKEQKKLKKRKAKAARKRQKEKLKQTKRGKRLNSNKDVHNTVNSQLDNERNKTKKEKKTYKPREKRKIRITTAQKKTIKIILSILIVLVILVVSAFVFGKIFFKVENIEIYGQSQYTQDEIKSATGLNISDNLLFCRTETIKENIENTLPCADVVYIKKDLPSTLVIEIKQTNAKFNILLSDCYAYMSDDYRIFDKGSEVRDNGIIVKGINCTFDEFKSDFANANNGVTLIFKSIVECCERLSFDGITEINLTDPMNPCIVYDGRITINLGTPEELDYKIQMAAKTLSSGSISDQIKGTLDVSLASDKNRTYFKPDYS